MQDSRMTNYIEQLSVLVEEAEVDVMRIKTLSKEIWAIFLQEHNGDMTKDPYKNYLDLKRKIGVILLADKAGHDIPESLKKTTDKSSKTNAADEMVAKLKALGALK